MASNFAALNDVTSEFDYVKLMELFSHYASPRDQITKLIKFRKIIRVKKGLYVLGPEFRRPFSKEILAGMIYGPSYISGMSALSFYQLIPERTEVTSSRTPNRHKIFDTPVGQFTYDYISLNQYRHSIARIQLDGQRSFLVATREKVLVELICKVKGIQTSSDLVDWMHSMRIDIEILLKLRIGELQALQKLFPSPQTTFLLEIVRREKK